MGSIFDFMDARSNHGAKGLTPLQEANRALLCDVMCANGFRRYDGEWWHYSVTPDPHPGHLFRFPDRIALLNPLYAA